MELNPKLVSLYELNENKVEDRFNFVYIIFLLSGMGTNLPWNFFITAKSYFDYKLRNRNLQPGQDYREPMFMTPEQIMFGSYLVVCSMLPLAICIILNFIIMKWLSNFKRFIIGIALLLSMFLLTVILVNIDISATTFLAITLVSVVIINCGAAFVQGSVFGTAAVFPPKYIKAALEGQAVSGIMASVANIITIAAASTPTLIGLSYFLIAVFFIAISSALFLTLPKNSFFNHYWLKKDIGTSDQENIGENEDHTKRSGNPFANLKQSLKEVLVPGICALITFLITLSLFPAVISLLRPIEPDSNDPWKGDYFVPVGCFLIFNVCDWVARIIAGLTKWPHRSQMKILVALTVVRVVLIPLVLLCNEQPRKYLPVVFRHDSIPIILNIILAASNGYLVTIATMHAPTFASPGNTEGAGIAMTIYLILGLLSGVAISAGFVAML